MGREWLASNVARALAVPLALLCTSASSDTAFYPENLSFCYDAPAIVAIGSSTVHPVLQLYTRNYVEEYVWVTTRSSDTELGLQNLLSGSTHLAPATRLLRPEDYAADCDPRLVEPSGVALGPCQGVLPAAVQLGSNRLALLLNPEHEWASAMSRDQAKQLLSGTKTWVDVFGYGDDIPDLVPNIHVPANGTLVWKFLTETLAVQPSGQLVVYHTEDAEIVDAIVDGINSVGVVPIGALGAGNSSQWLVVELDGVDPLSSDESYVLRETLWVYYDARNNETAGRVESFLCGLISDGGQQAVARAGYRGLDPQDAALQRQALGCDDPDRTSGIGPVGSNDAEALPHGSIASEQFLFCRDARPLVVVGSNTLHPFLLSMSTTHNVNPFLYPYSGGGSTGVGIASFLAGASELAAASRRFSPQDYERLGCPADGVTAGGIPMLPCRGRVPAALAVAHDPLVLVVHPGSRVTDMSLDAALELFSTLTSWQQADVAGAGSELLRLCVPPAESGTRWTFLDYGGRISPNVAGFLEFESLVRCVESDRGSLGLMGLQAARAAGERVRVVSIDGVEPPVDALDFNSSSYPLLRDLYVMYDVTQIGLNGVVLQWMCRLLSPVGQHVAEELGYIPLLPEEVQGQLQKQQLLCAYQPENGW